MDGYYIDLAGFDFTLSDATQPSFWDDGEAEIVDSVGGSVITGTISMSGGSLKLGGNITLTSGNAAMILGSGALDLTDYTGGEMRIYVEHLTDFSPPSSGYGLFDFDGNPIESIENQTYVYVRLVEQIRIYI